MNTPDTKMPSREEILANNKRLEKAQNEYLSMNTPDTEEKKHVAYSPEVNQIRPILVKYFNEYPADLLADLSDLLSSRDTYWKERVRKEVEKLRKPETTFLKEGDETWDYSHIIAHNQALDTLLDNLK